MSWRRTGRTPSHDAHTCHDECPCQRGDEPMQDFLPAEGAVPVLGWFGYLEHLADVAAARRASPSSDQPKET